jgi:ribosome-binding factor A
MPTIRQARVGEMIKRELAEIFQKEMRDPRLSLISVTEVDVARDFTVAKVFVSVIGTPQEKADALKALQGASGFLRGRLGRVLDLRAVPALMFRYDTGIERGARMFELLREEEQALSENPPHEDADENVANAPMPADAAHATTGEKG